MSRLYWRRPSDYAERLQVQYTFSTNGDEIYRVDMQAHQEGEVDRFPTPEELWEATYEEANEWREKLASEPFHTKGQLAAPDTIRRMRLRGSVMRWPRTGTAFC